MSTIEEKCPTCGGPARDEIRCLRSALVKNAAALAGLLSHDATTKELQTEIFRIMSSMRKSAYRVRQL